MWDVVLDSLLDTLKLFPFLFLLYLLIELLEHNTAVSKPHRALSGKCAPLIGAATGLVPLCGFSVMAAKLYEHRHVTLGTLFAVFVATNDEALLVLLLSDLGWAAKAVSIAAICGSKFVLGVAAGYLIDFLFGRRAPAPLPVEEPAHSHHDHGEHVHSHHDHEEHEHEEHYSACEHAHESKVHLYLISPLLHALQVAAFVLLVNLAFGFLIHGVGEERVFAFLQAGYWYQPLVACVVGLIPNCASSVVLAEAFAVSGISFGSCLAGLVVNTGLGCLVLMRNVRAWKRTLAIVAALFVLGVAVGYAAQAIELIIPPL